MEDVTAAFGKPREIVQGESAWKDEVLYLPQRSVGYIQYNDQGARFFLTNSNPREVISIYLFKSGTY